MRGLALILVAGIAGCGPDRPEVVVLVENGGLAIPGDIDDVSILVRDVTRDKVMFTSPAGKLCRTPADAPCHDLPMSAALIPGPMSPDDQIEVVVTASRLGSPRIRNAATFTFTPGQRQWLQFVLHDACLDTSCADDAERRACGSDGACTRVVLTPTRGDPPADLGVDAAEAMDQHLPDATAMDLPSPSDSTSSADLAKTPDLGAADQSALVDQAPVADQAPIADLSRDAGFVFPSVAGSSTVPFVTQCNRMFAIPPPGTAIAGDLMLVAVTVNGLVTDVTPPSGWTPITSLSDVADGFAVLWYAHTYATAEAAYPFSINGCTYSSGLLLGYRNAAAVQGYASNPFTGSPFSAPSASGVAGGKQVTIAAQVYLPAVNTSANFSTPAGMSQRTTHSTVSAWDRPLLDDNPTGALSFTGNNYWTGVATFVIR